MTLANVNCAACGVLFAMPANLNAERRSDHESFYCPNGHTNYYPHKSKEEKLKEELERTRRDRAERIAIAWDTVREWKTEARKCPLCGERVTLAQSPDTIYRKVAEHLKDEHGAKARLRAIPETTSAAR